MLSAIHIIFIMHIHIFNIIDYLRKNQYKPYNCYRFINVFAQMSVFAVVSKHEEVPKHDPHDAIIQDPPAAHHGGIQDPPVPPPSSRQRAVAHVLPISMSQVARDMAGRDPIKARETFDNTYKYNSEQANPDFTWFAVDKVINVRLTTSHDLNVRCLHF